MNPNVNGGYYSFLRLCQELEDKKIGGLGGFDAKPLLKDIKDRGSILIEEERMAIQSTLQTIKIQLKELSRQSDGDRKTIKEAVTAMITKTIQDSMQTTPADFYIRKQILIDGKYCNDPALMFLTSSPKNEVSKQVVRRTLRSKGYRHFSDSFFDLEDLLDLELILILFDCAFGNIEDTFFNECLGVEENLFDEEVLNEEVAIDVEDVANVVEEVAAGYESEVLNETEHVAETESYSPLPQKSYTPEPVEERYSPPSEPSYSAPSESSYSSGSDDCGGGGGCDD